MDQRGFRGEPVMGIKKVIRNGRIKGCVWLSETGERVGIVKQKAFTALF